MGVRQHDEKYGTDLSVAKRPHNDLEITSLSRACSGRVWSNFPKRLSRRNWFSMCCACGMVIRWSSAGLIISFRVGDRPCSDTSSRPDLYPSWLT